MCGNCQASREMRWKEHKVLDFGTHKVYSNLSVNWSKLSLFESLFPMSKNRKITVLILKVKGDNICENALKKKKNLWVYSCTSISVFDFKIWWHLTLPDFLSYGTETRTFSWYHVHWDKYAAVVFLFPLLYSPFKERNGPFLLLSRSLEFTKDITPHVWYVIYTHLALGPKLQYLTLSTFISEITVL